MNQTFIIPRNKAEHKGMETIEENTLTTISGAAGLQIMNILYASILG